MNPPITNYSTASAPSRRGWLRHGNRPGDYARAPRCGARTRAGGGCRQPAMRNGRCRMHGGFSTGPRTAEGLARSQRARWTHGFCSAEIRSLRREAAHTAQNLAHLVRLSRDLCRRRAVSSLGMGFIERNRPAAGPSSGAVDGPEGRKRKDAKTQRDSAAIGLTAPGMADHLCASASLRFDASHHPLDEDQDTRSSLGMGFIERNPYSAGPSGGAPGTPGLGTCFPALWNAAKLASNKKNQFEP